MRFILSILLVTTHVAFAQTKTAQECPVVRYTAGAGIKIRAEARAVAKEVGVLRFNSKFCEISKSGEWTKILIPTTPAKIGWINTEFVASSPNFEPPLSGYGQDSEAVFGSQNGRWHWLAKDLNY